MSVIYRSAVVPGALVAWIELSLRLRRKGSFYGSDKSMHVVCQSIIGAASREQGAGS